MTGGGPWRWQGRGRPPFADEPGPGQESAWDYPRPPRIEADSRRVRVLDGDGRVVADTTRALRVLETASPPTFYLPAADVDTGALVAAPGASLCEWKGRARYWALESDPGRPVAWTYPDPSPAFAAIAGHFAFYPSRVACTVDGERVRAQAGDFYGGWITDDVVGPFKGDPGTGHW